MQTKKLLEYFVAGIPARTSAELVGVNRNTSSKFYDRLRQVIALRLGKATPFMDGEIEVDESYFGGARKGKRGRGAAGKMPVFGLLKRNGKVYAQVIPDSRGSTLMGIMRTKIKPDSIIYTDGSRSYNVLDVSEFKHHRIGHSREFARGGNHINGIENFWSQAKRRLRSYNGIPREKFPLFLKECELCFNHGTAQEQLTTLKKWVRMELKAKQTA